MRVALLTTNLQPNNGWATVAVNRGAALMRLGVEVVMLTSRGDAPPEGITPTTVLPILPRVVVGGRPKLDLLAANPAIARQTAGCDLIDVVAEPYALGCIQASFARPLVVTANGSYVPATVTYGPARPLYRWLYRRAHLIAVSDYTAARAGAVLGIPPPEVILSGVDYDFYQPRRPSPKKRGPTVLFVGAVKRRKGVDILIEAMAQVRRSVPDAVCVIAGYAPADPYVSALRDRIKALDLEQHVELTGKLPYEEIVAWYQSADVFVLPSVNLKIRFEGFGLVYLEANACGVPAIGTLGTGAESAIVDGQTGFLVPQRDSGALAARISEVLTDPALRDRLSTGAREFARAQTWDHSAARVLRFYEQVLASRR